MSSVHILNYGDNAKHKLSVDIDLYIATFAYLHFQWNYEDISKVDFDIKILCIMFEHGFDVCLLGCSISFVPIHPKIHLDV